MLLGVCMDIVSLYKVLLWWEFSLARLANFKSNRESILYCAKL